MTEDQANEVIKDAYIKAAETFEIYASDQLASKRWSTLKKHQRECDLRAEVWNAAALALREAADA